jgi:PAS domain S-box-containing protein
VTGSNIKNGFFEHLGKTLKDAFLVFSVQGDILFFNDEAKSLLNISSSAKKIFEIFSGSALEKFKEFICNVMDNLNFISSALPLELCGGEIINVEIVLSCYNQGEQQLILCTLTKKRPNIESREVSKIKTRLNKFEELITNKKIIDIISKIKTSYPFTFLGKEKLRAEIDAFEENFWIRNAEGIYLLVNKNLARALGSNAVQIEGKEENSFLAPYLAEFNWALDSYLKQTGNCIIVEGLPFKGLSVQSSLQTIEIPLRDADNNVTAVIGITQKKFAEHGQPDGNIKDIAPEIIRNLPVPFAYFNREEILIHSTEEFCKLFGIHFPEIGKFTFRLFPANLVAKFDGFIRSSLNKEKFEFSQPGLGYKFQEGFSCHLNKVYGANNQFEGVSLLIEESTSELNQRGKMVNAFIQKNPEPIFVYDKDNLKFLDVNKSALSLYGYNKEQFLQMDLTDLYSAEDIQSLLESSEYALKEGEFTGPFKHKKKDGSLIVVELSKIGIKYNDKDAFLNIIRDISDKFEEEKKTRLYKSAFEKTDDLLFITDASGFIKLINNAVLNKLGYSDKEINDASFATLTTDEERGNINSSIFQSKSKEPQTITTTMKKSSGEAIKAELNVTPVLDYKNEIDSFNIIATLKADEVKPPVKVEPSDEDETGTISPVFLSSLFHEILTPINAILGFVQELTESIQTKTPEQKEAAKIINQNRASLLHTLNTIAEYTSLERNEYDISSEEVHITEIVEKLQKEIEEFSGLRGTEFAYGKISSSLKFKTDKYKFMSLISLLIRIVIRLSKEKKIFLSAYQLDEEFFIVTVRDQHSSVSKYLLDSLNAIFQKEKVEKEFGVSKISINLSKILMNLLNARFEVLVKEGNKLDYGFLFPFGFPVEQKKVEKEKPGKAKDKSAGKTVKEEEKPEPEVKTIPLEEGIKWERGTETTEELVLEEFEPQPAPPPAKPSRQVDLSKITCLYIEDQIDSQILFKVQMKDLNDIKFAVSFEEAIPLFKSYNFDLIVIDMNLSGEYNGLDALKMIHQISGFEATPVIAVSAYVLPGDKEKFISSGFSDFISKPLFREKMIDSINKIFPAE